MAAVTVAVTPADGASTANQNSYTSPSFTPANGDLLVVFAECSGSLLSGGAAGTLSASANGITFTRAKAILDQAAAGQLYCFVANQLVGASPSAMTVTLSVVGDNGTGAIISVLRVSGMTKVGNAAIKQTIPSAEGIAAGTTPAVTFGAACQTGNPILAAMVTNQLPAITPPSGMTEAGEGSYATPGQGMEVAYRNSGFTGTTVTWGSNSPSTHSQMAVELDASGGGGSLAASMDDVQIAGYDSFTITANPTGGTAPYTHSFSQLSGTSTSLSGSGASRSGTAPPVQAGDTLVYKDHITDNVGGTVDVQCNVVVAPHSWWYRKAGAWVPRRRWRRSGGSWV